MYIQWRRSASSFLVTFITVDPTCVPNSINRLRPPEVQEYRVRFFIVILLAWHLIGMDVWAQCSYSPLSPWNLSEIYVRYWCYVVFLACRHAPSGRSRQRTDTICTSNCFLFTCDICSNSAVSERYHMGMLGCDQQSLGVLNCQVRPGSRVFSADGRKRQYLARTIMVMF